jgi:hypothetical protein
VGGRIAIVGFDRMEPIPIPCGSTWRGSQLADSIQARFDRHPALRAFIGPRTR